MSLFFAGLVGLVVGLVAGSVFTSIRKAKELDEATKASDGRWRVSMSKLVGHLLTLGYETKIEDDVFEVDATPGNYLISMSIRRFAPTALLESLADLPPARDWVAHREGDEEDEPGEDPPSDPPTDEPQTATAAPADPPA
jgi:hypothetical protein